MDEVPDLDEKLVVVCHCKIHPKLHTVKYKNEGNIYPLGFLYRQLGPSVTYVDPLCEGNTWDKIEASSKKYVWAFNCPVYPAIEGGLEKDMYTDTLLSILDESYRVLEPGGYLIFGLYYDPSEKALDTFKILNKWTIKILPASEFLFNLGKEGDIKQRLLIFTKVQEGGKRKRRRTRRQRQRQRRKTKAKH